MNTNKLNELKDGYESGQSELLLIIMIAIVAVVIYAVFQPIMADLFAGLPK